MNNRLKLVIEALEDLEINSPETRFEMARIIAINELKKISNSEWIPCSEKLPTSSGRFEVTVKGAKGKRHVEIFNFDKGTNSWWNSGYYFPPAIIAWRSRPEPYKEVDKVAKALGKFTDDINEHNPKALEEYTKDLTPFERKEFIELAEFSLMARQAFLKDKSLEVENE